MEISTAGLLLQKVQNVVIRGLTVTPPGNDRAEIWLKNASRVTVDNVLFDGRIERAGAGFKLEDTDRDVTIQNSELTNCGEGSTCIGLGGTYPGTSRLTIRNNRFHDCFDCDFLRGSGSDITVVGNSFDRAVPGTCKGGQDRCHHNDLVQIVGGHGWRIEQNRFGVYERGSAQIYVNGYTGSHAPISDVLIQNNLFDGGEVMADAIGVGTNDAPGGAPRNVRVINNTILSGKGTLRLGWVYRNWPVGERPLLANNIILNQPKALNNCRFGNFVSNVVIKGEKCDSSDDLGNPQLSSNGRPTANSNLVIDRASGMAPDTDFDGKHRSGRPDRGAFEF